MSQPDPHNITWRTVDAHAAAPDFRVVIAGEPGESFLRDIAAWLIERAFRLDPLTGEETEAPEWGIRTVAGIVGLDRDRKGGDYIASVFPAHWDGTVMDVLDPSEPDPPGAIRRGGE